MKEATPRGVRAIVLTLLFAMAGCATAVDERPPPTTGQLASPVSLDFLAGDWTLHDPAGATVGHSSIEIQAASAMLFERRRISQAAEQPLWFENAERTEGWVQLFVNPAGQVREFSTQSPNGSWPLVLGGDVTLRDGATARFRLTIWRASDDESRRLLEVSRDGGGTWSAALDYTYRRAR